jgi:hypothetical protein
MKKIKLASLGMVLLVISTILIGMTDDHLKSAHAAEHTTENGAYTTEPTTTYTTTPQNFSGTNSTNPPPMPASIQVPPGNVLFAQIVGVGDLIFSCPITAASIEIPFIPLFSGKTGVKSIGTHFIENGGLYWEDLAGNRVLAVPIAKVPSPIDPNANAPWVLLQAQAHIGTGPFSQVTFIQRVLTNGGVPSAANCMGNNQIEETVPFTTVYLFYRAA